MLRVHPLLLIALALLLGACASPARQDIHIAQTARGVEIRSSDRILFDSGQADIKPEGGPFLDHIATLLNTRTRQPVLIEGHTDNVGPADLNRDLSELRALAVMKGLMDRGVPKSRMRYAGYGMSRPIADNSTPEGRMLNRRTEIIILNERRDNMAGPLDELAGVFNGVVEFGRRLFTSPDRPATAR